MTFVTTLLNCVSSLENDVEVQVFTRLDSYAFEFLITETRIYNFVYSITIHFNNANFTILQITKMS